MAEYKTAHKWRIYKEKLCLLPSVEIFKCGKIWGIELAWFAFSFIAIVFKKHRKEVKEDG